MSGLLLHPRLGNRLALLAVLTTARMPADPKVPNPCLGCGRCVASCPGQCFDPAAKYPDSYSLASCLASRERELAQEGEKCQNCYLNCPASSGADEELAAWLTRRG